MKIPCVAVAAAALFLLSCGRGNESKEAIRQGVIDYLSSRPGIDVRSMQIEVTAVQFRKDEADATVSFRGKDAPPGAGMQMNYTLERKGTRWAVKSRRDSGANPHGGAGQMPGTGSMPGMEGQGSGAVPNQMPPGHPAIPMPPGNKK